MFGPVICAVARTASQSLSGIFVKEAIRAVAVAAGTAAVAGAARIVRDNYDRQREAQPRLQNNGGWR